MRILLICDDGGEGAAARQVLRLARALDEREHRVVVAGPGNSWLSRRCFASVIDHHDVPMRGSTDVRSFYRLLSIVQHRGTELVHGYGGRSPLYAGVVARLARKPAVATFHAPEEVSHCGLLHRILATHETLRRRLLADRLLVGRIDVIHEGVPEPPPHAVEQRAVLRSELGMRADDVAIAVRGPLDPRAGHRLVIRAVERLHRLRPNVHLCVIGGAATAHSEALRHGLLESEVERRVHLLDAPLTLPALLPAVDILVLPDPATVTRLAVIEALAGGVPVISAVTEGVREVVRHGQTGLLFARGDGAMLDAMLTMLVEDPGWRARLGAHSRRVYRECFTLERMVTETERIYREVGGDPTGEKRSGRKAS